MKTAFLSIMVTIIALCFGNSASAQILNPRPVSTHHGYPQTNHPRHRHHDERNDRNERHDNHRDERHDNGLHKGWSNRHNPHSGMKGYKRKD